MSIPVNEMRPMDSDASEAKAGLLRLTPMNGAILIAVLACLAYLPCLNGRFIFDDNLYLTANRYIDAPDGLFWFWFTNRPLEFYPISNTSLWLEWRLWGTNPAGYHVTNLLLHIGSALLVWAVLQRLGIPGAFFAGLLFAVHPVNVESVAWISQRKDLLALVFFLLSIFWYLKADEFLAPGRRSAESQPDAARQTAAGEKWYRLSLLAFVLAMLSKGTPAILPIVLLGLAWWRRGRICRADLSRSVPFFLVAIALSLMNVWTQNHLSDPTLHWTFAARLCSAGTAVWFYLCKALLPIHLIFVYPMWHVQMGNLLWWLPLLAAASLTAILLWRSYMPAARVSRSLLFAWGTFCVALLPTLGFADIPYLRFSRVADHYQHIAIISVVGLIAAIWSIWNKRVPAIRPAAMATAVAAVLMLTFLTWQQTHIYADPITLYEAILAKNPDAALIRCDLAAELNRAGRLQEAIELCQQVIRSKHQYAEAYHTLAIIYDQLGKFDEAEKNYQQALHLQPDSPNVCTDYATLLGKRDKVREASAQFEHAIALDPSFADAHSGLALAYFKSGEPQKAIDEFEEAIRYQPKHGGAHAGLAAVFAQQGRLEEAAEHYRQALKIRPQFTDACFHLAETYARMQQPANAVAAAQHAIDLAASQGQTVLENRIRSWLDNNRAQLNQPGDAPGPSGH